eukprot:3358384-Amphidinium_carterae.1
MDALAPVPPASVEYLLPAFAGVRVEQARCKTVGATCFREPDITKFVLAKFCLVPHMHIRQLM